MNKTIEKNLTPNDNLETIKLKEKLKIIKPFVEEWSKLLNELKENP